MAMTSRPSSVSSFAMIEPVQPSPMITTSFLGSFRDIAASLCFLRPGRAAGDGHRRQRIALVVPFDPVEIVVAGARIPDHLPRDHVAVAAIERIGEEAGLDILEDLFEERLAVGRIELDRTAFDALEQ